MAAQQILGILTQRVKNQELRRYVSDPFLDHQLISELRMVGQNAPDHFFEGAEKLLSIWFTTEDGGEEHGDLKKIPREKWDELVSSVDAEILSEIGDEEVRKVDSQSSLRFSIAFIIQNR